MAKVGTRAFALIGGFQLTSCRCASIQVSMSLTIKTRGKDTASLAQSKSQELTGAFIAALTLEVSEKN